MIRRPPISPLFPSPALSRAPAPRPPLGSRCERLASHVPAEDHDVGLVVFAGIEELAPASLRTVDVRSKEDARVGFSGKEPGDHRVPPIVRDLLLPLLAARTSACDPLSSSATSSQRTSAPARYAPATPGCGLRCAVCRLLGGRSAPRGRLKSRGLP